MNVFVELLINFGSVKWYGKKSGKDGLSCFRGLISMKDPTGCELDPFYQS